MLPATAKAKPQAKSSAALNYNDQLYAALTTPAQQLGALTTKPWQQTTATSNTYNVVWQDTTSNATYSSVASIL